MYLDLRMFVFSIFTEKKLCKYEKKIALQEEKNKLF